MLELTIQQVRAFRLHMHHLNRYYKKSDLIDIVGTIGIQNSPPGAWEYACIHRIPQLRQQGIKHALYEEKTLLQAWSYRGVPVVFPTRESGVFLSSLIANDEEPWIYTNGITLALDALDMKFDYLYKLLKQVILQLNTSTMISKTMLDQTLADWMLPYIPEDKQGIWNQPSMYGDKQSIGGAVVSFMLRPCAFEGLVVFGKRDGISPTFTSYQNWLGYPMISDEKGIKKLVEKFVHCYGPINKKDFITWLGCSTQQGKRMWNMIVNDLVQVSIQGDKAMMLASDLDVMMHNEHLEREFILLNGHDPYLDQRDRWILQEDKGKHKKIWRTVSNPGVLLYRGEIIGIWNSYKKTKGMDIIMETWKSFDEEDVMRQLIDFANYQNLTINQITVNGEIRR